jgi:4-aminobutyrate aminotransferase-like enzyme
VAVAPVVADGKAFAIVRTMTKLLQDAIERLKDLPERRQDELAVALIEVTEGDQGDYHLTDEQVEEVRRRRASPNRKFMSVAEARKRLRHFGV